MHSDSSSGLLFAFKYDIGGCRSKENQGQDKEQDQDTD